jgi:CMP-N,N'-diacetyllegionaminic acid synthase
VIGGRQVLAVIPARGGSKGLPGKNLLKVNGRPLIAWSVDAAQAASHIDRVVLSSEDEAIINAARECGCEVPFIRPNSLATDLTATFDVVLHALDSLPGYDVVVVLQPTSPLRTVGDIDTACERFGVSGASSCVSVTAVSQNPYWMYRVDERQTLMPLLETLGGISRRQDLPPVYALNGALYIADVSWLRRNRGFMGNDTIAYVMPAERSIDIDSFADFETFRRSVTEGAHA